MPQGISPSADPQLFWLYAIGGLLAVVAVVAVYIAVVALKAKRGAHQELLTMQGSIDKQIELQKQSEQKFRTLLESVPDAIVVISRDGLIKITNSQAEKLFGYAPGELADKNAELLIAPRSRKGDQGDKMGVFTDSAGRVSNTEQEELFALRKDGKEFAIEMRLSSMESEQGALVASAIREVTKKKQSERNFSLQYKVAKALNESHTFKGITSNLLRITGEEMHWVSGSYWVPDSVSNVLRCVDFWSLPKHSDTSFAQQTKRITFAPSTGLPGRVWVNNDSLWIEDVRKDTNFPRASAAWESGICSGIAFPVSLGDKVFGVCEFFSEGVQPVDEEMHMTLNSFGRQIGQFVARQQMQSTLQATEERFDILVSAVADYAVVMLDAKGLVVDWSDGAKRMYGYSPAEITGMSFVTVLSTEYSEIGKLEAWLDRARDEGGCKDLGWCVRKDGSRFRAEISLTALKDEQGQIRGFGTVTHDLTSQANEGA